MIDALLYFSVGRAGHWALDNWAPWTRKEGVQQTSERFAASKSECSWLCFGACSELKSEVKCGFSDLFLFPQAVNHSLELHQVCLQTNDR